MKNDKYNHIFNKCDDFYIVRGVKLLIHELTGILNCMTDIS